MKHQITLTISSLLSILLFSLHWADEVARGLEPGTMAGFGGLLILAVWLCGTLDTPACDKCRSSRRPRWCRSILLTCKPQ